jgi:hypothetical protein
VIDTGEKQVVYVEREPGTFEGVEVTLGPRAGDRYPVLAGLAPGDKVATAGSFLIDAETRLNPAAASAFFGATGGPQTGHDHGTVRRSDDTVGEKSNGKSEGASPSASVTFTAEQLANLAKLTAADQALAKRQKLCPVTELPLGSMGPPLKRTVEGETLFLCCPGCDATLKAEPKKYLDKVRALRGEKIASAKKT